MQQHNELPGVRFRIDSDSLFVEFDQSVPVPEHEGITECLAAKLFDDSEVTVTVMPGIRCTSTKSKCIAKSANNASESGFPLTMLRSGSMTTTKILVRSYASGLIGANSIAPQPPGLPIKGGDSF